MREEGYEQSEFEYVPLRFYRLPVYIYQITGRYKCIKRYSQWKKQPYLRCRIRGSAYYGGDAAGQEVKVFQDK